MTTNSAVSMELDIDFGWCTWRIVTDADVFEAKTHWTADGFSHLFDAVLALANGTPSVSVVWAREAGGGCFIDLLRDPEGGVSIVVHDRAHGIGARTVDAVHSAERGAVRFRAHIPWRDFIRSFATAVRTVRVRCVDGSGYMKHWQRTFPQAEHEALERIAGRWYGYKPVPTTEISPPAAD